MNARSLNLSKLAVMPRVSPLSRRAALRGLGVTVALPMLEAMGPLAATAAAPASPLRMAFAYTPNGVIMDRWIPKKTGKDFELPTTLQPLKSHQGQLQVLSGLDHDKANANGDGGGDHARANSTFLTGCQAKKTAGADIRIGVSVDQLAARNLTGKTRLDSLELGCDLGRKAGRCDSGYSCAYQFNFSWKSENVPMPPEIDPRIIFEKLFGGGVLGDSRENRERRAKYNQSILDYVRDDAKTLQSKLGATDRDKIEEYLTGVRELERKIQQSEKFAQQLPDSGKTPAGIPREYKDHIRQIYDLMALAFQTDSTRIASFLVAHDGSNRSFKEVGVPDGHHYLSHHGADKTKIEKLAKIDRFYVEQFAYFLEKLKSIKEGDGNLLDHSMVVYGGGHSDGNRHDHVNLPVILAGGGNGRLGTGRHVNFGAKPMTNLYLTMLDYMGAGEGVEKLGDSTGRLSGI
ncbi:MAG: hypothetical protein ACI8UO_003193 [Verrucomicrobiales bacterium]